jgi:hypothetical protein
MSDDPKKPDVGDMRIDASHLEGIVVDLPPGGRIGLRKSQPNFPEAIAELISNQPLFGAAAGIRDEEPVAIQAGIQQMADIDALLPAAEKLVELLQETRAVIDDRLQKQVFTIAETVDRRARMMGDDELRARYARTLEYRSAIGNKAARTRQRNLAAQAQDENAN